VNMLVNSTDNRIRTHILTGIDMVCAKHQQFYGDVLKGLEQFDPKNNAAVGIAGNTLLTNAEKAGIDVAPDLKDRFSKAAGVLSVLSGSKHDRIKKK